MDIGLVIKYLYPQATLDDFSVSQEPGGEPYISYWNATKLGPQPTQQQLRDAWKPAAGKQKRSDFIRATDRDFGTIFTSRVEFDYIVVRRLQGKTITLEQQQKADRVLALFDKLTRGNSTVDAYTSDTTKTAEDIIALRWETV